MGSSKSVDVGTKYFVAWHVLLGKRMDAVLEVRGGDKTAWSGNVTASTVVNVNEPELFGGDSDQGGMAGPMAIMMGEADQEPNPYLVATFGDRTVAWRGFTGIAWQGGEYGSNNPYPFKMSAKTFSCYEIWDEPPGWYPEKARIDGLPALSPFIWRHVELSCDGNIVRLFVEGKLKMLAVLDYTPNGGSGGQTTIGRYSADPGDGGAINAYVRNVRVTKAVRHTTDFTPSRDIPSAVSDPHWGSVIASLPMTASVTADDMGNPWTLYDADAEISDDVSFDGLPAAYFHGGNVRTPYTAGLNVGSYFTIDFWVKPVALQGNVICVNQFHSIHPGYTPAIQSTGQVWAYFGRNYWPSEGVVLVENIPAPVLSMNPVHVIVHAHTHSEMAGNPLETINDASARAAADWYYAQGFGLNAHQRVTQESPADLIKRIERVAGLSFTRDMTTGQWHFYVANGEYDLESLPILTDDDIVSFKDTPTVPDNAVNSVQVKYFDPERKENVATPFLRALGQVHLYGEIQQVHEFPEIPTGTIANRVAWREALASVTPHRVLDLVAIPTGAATDINRGQYFRLQAPKRGIADMVCSMGEKKEGTLKSGNLALTVVQDIYSLPDTVYSDVEHGVDTRPSQVPVAIIDQAAFEAPWIEVCQRLPRAELDALPDDVGFLVAVAADPASSRDFTLMVAPSGGSYVDNGLGDFCPTALVNEAADKVQTTFTLSAGKRLTSVEVGDPVLWGNELCRVDAIDATALTIELGRGCADTVEQLHAAGERLFFYRDGAAYDPSEHVDGESADVKLLTNTGSKRLDAALATALPVTFDQRLFRPYPPGQFTINDAAYPLFAFGELSIGGAHRDRLLQADQLIDQTMASIGPEPGTTYTARYYANGVLEHTETDITTFPTTYTPAGDCLLRVELESELNGLESWLMQVHELPYFMVNPDPITDENDEPLLDEADNFIY